VPDWGVAGTPCCFGRWARVFWCSMEMESSYILGKASRPLHPWTTQMQSPLRGDRSEQKQPSKDLLYERPSGSA
jgi:hypothetical protein